VPLGIFMQRNSLIWKDVFFGLLNLGYESAGKAGIG
jgi:hypothetical protein